MNWKEIIRKNHCGYGESTNYGTMLKDAPIESTDLKYFERVINNGVNGGQSGYDSFPDNGGIDIASVLLAEVKRLRAEA